MSIDFTKNIKKDVAEALAEDLGGSVSLSNDITAQLVDEHTSVTAQIIAREPGIICGIEWASEAFLQLDEGVHILWEVEDGDQVTENQVLAKLSGRAQVILTAERTALNFLQTLSGTATTTRKYVGMLADSNTKLLDTRKTIPNLRLAQKYAVKCGGGHNHRIGLFDAFLIKENHIAACGGIAEAIQKARSVDAEKLVEVEVENLNELQEAIDAQADVVMLDNFDTKQILEAVELNKQACKLEVSGNITETRLKELAKIGVDFVSSGALTKHVHALDLSLLIE
ncbi:carboxylating nicotinate-nucleotide diphosphorylase [Agaribacter flavus]|uniref:nicotinate-nucleotide diphosphorylase (carboxylating) n=1 Tax=Agaribacter flavus TaxID=1902781 RepID=A0ABV7FNV2_9ALTE